MESHITVWMYLFVWVCMFACMCEREENISIPHLTMMIVLWNISIKQWTLCNLYGGFQQTYKRYCVQMQARSPKEWEQKEEKLMLTHKKEDMEKTFKYHHTDTQKSHVFKLQTYTVTPETRPFGSRSIMYEESSGNRLPALTWWRTRWSSCRESSFDVRTFSPGCCPFLGFASFFLRFLSSAPVLDTFFPNLVYFVPLSHSLFSPHPVRMWVSSVCVCVYKSKPGQTLPTVGSKY